MLGDYYAQFPALHSTIQDVPAKNWLAVEDSELAIFMVSTLFEATKVIKQSNGMDTFNRFNKKLGDVW